MKSNLSWFTGTCRDCGYNVVVTQATEKHMDYWWYCSNKECKNHIFGKQTGDTDIPEWVKCSRNP